MKQIHPFLGIFLAELAHKGITECPVIYLKAAEKMLSYVLKELEKDESKLL